ncbi:MAG: 2,4'-dihydroxyacetophenone dioxygenase family protein [Porticoccaceae bacterium]|nr:2,4'-dihydroxyacetophenone dioxygenase family protein [Porticoccaceae bacterium]
MSHYLSTDDDYQMGPYKGKANPLAYPEIVINDVFTKDEKIWVPLGDQIWSRPLCFNVAEGYFTHILRVRKTGVFNRHRHGSPVHGLVLKGCWGYLERDWLATEGSYIYEPPGDTHTLYLPEGVEEMMTFFYTPGSLVFVDPDGNMTGFEDVFKRLEKCQDYYEEIGLGRDFVKQFVR